MEELIFGEALAVFLADDEPRQHVDVRITQVAATLVDEDLQISEELGDRSVACHGTLGRQYRLQCAEDRERPVA